MISCMLGSCSAFEPGHADEPWSAPAGHLQRLHLECMASDRLEGVVDASPVGDRLDLLDRISVARVDDLGGTETEGRFALHGHRVDGDDPCRAGHLCAEDGRGSHASRADDRDGRARSHLGRVDRGASRS